MRRVADWQLGAVKPNIRFLRTLARKQTLNCRSTAVRRRKSVKEAELYALLILY